MKNIVFGFLLVLIFGLAGCNFFAPANSDSEGTCTGTAHFTWEPPRNSSNQIDSSVLGYNIYNGFASRTYDQLRDTQLVMPALSPAYTLTGLQIGRTYYFAVTAYNSNGESGYSNEVSKAFTFCGETIFIHMEGKLSK